jgi:hypothetical protein
MVLCSKVQLCLLDTKCKICGKEAGDIFTNYCSLECLNDAMQKLYTPHT